MVNNYFASIAFSLCALVFALNVLIMHNSKQKFKNLENTVFYILLIMAIALILVEFLYVLCLAKVDGEPGWFTYFSCRLYLVGIIAWMFIFIYYILVQLTRKFEVEVKKKKRKNFLYILSGFAFIAIIFAIFLPIELHYSKDALYTFDGEATNIGYGVGAVLIISVIYWLFSSNKEMTNEQKRPLFVATAFVIGVTIIQFFIDSADFNIQNFQFVSILASLFFTLESQDNKLLSEREKSKEEAEVLNKAQTAFLTSMSHEIRTPMSTIMGFSESLLRDADLTEETVKHDTKYIHIAAVSLLDLINNILDLSRIDSEKETIVDQEFELKQFLFEINDIIHTKLEDKAVNFEINLDENLPSKYSADAPKINKIIINLASYLLNKPAITEISLNVVEHKAEDQDFMFQLTIMASTNGFEDVYQSIANEFNDLKDNEVDNLTLGLIVAKRYIKMMNGSIEVNFNDEFIKYDLYIPAQVFDSTPVGNIFEELKNIQDMKLDLTGKKILVVDDNAINIKLISRLLGEYNPDLDSCNNGLACIDKVQEKKYDVIFLDHMMPGLDGVETLAKMKDLMSDLPPVIA